MKSFSLQAFRALMLTLCLTFVASFATAQNFGYTNPAGVVGESTDIICEHSFSPTTSVTVTFSSDKLKATPGLQIDTSGSSFCSDGNVDVSVTVSPDGMSFTVTIVRTDGKALPGAGMLFKTSGGGGGSHIIMLPLI